MSQNLSGKYYQENKKSLREKARERYQNGNVTKISQKMKKINWLSIEKK